MCYYNSIKVTKEEYDELKALEKVVAFLNEDFAIHKGFDYGDYPIIRPIGKTHETERVKMQWGFLPSYLRTWEDVNKFRNGYKDESGRYYKPYLTLNATSEELLNKIYKDAALKRRCLIPSIGFYEWMHVQVVGKSGKLLKTPGEISLPGAHEKPGRVLHGRRLATLFRYRIQNGHQHLCPDYHRCQFPDETNSQQQREDADNFTGRSCRSLVVSRSL